MSGPTGNDSGWSLQERQLKSRLFGRNEGNFESDGCKKPRNKRRRCDEATLGG
jgi:hypothetical protein